MKQRIMFLVSGNGGTLGYIINAQKELGEYIDVCYAISDRKCKALTVAEENNIKNEIIPYNREKDSHLLNKMLEIKPDIVISTFHKILGEDIVNEFKGKIINLHYSLLPSFGNVIGMKTLELAKERNVGFIGATCHYVNKNIDAGKIIIQSCLSVDWNEDSYNNLMNITFRSACICLLSSLLSLTEYKFSSINSLEIENKKVYFSPQIYNISYLKYFNN